MIAVDRLTWNLFVALAGVLLAWEVVLLVLRARGAPRPRTISQVVMERSKEWTCAPFVWGALATHYWPVWPSRADVYTTWGYAVAIGAAVALLVLDVVLWRRGVRWAELPRWARWARWPFLWLGLGLLAGAFLFVQRTVQPWEGG